MPLVSWSRVPSLSQLHADTCTLLPSPLGPLATAFLASLPLILPTLAACWLLPALLLLDSMLSDVGAQVT